MATVLIYLCLHCGVCVCFRFWQIVSVFVIHLNLQQLIGLSSVARLISYYSPCDFYRVPSIFELFLTYIIPFSSISWAAYLFNTSTTIPHPQLSLAIPFRPNIVPLMPRPTLGLENILTSHDARLIYGLIMNDNASKGSLYDTTPPSTVLSPLRPLSCKLYVDN